MQNNVGSIPNFIPEEIRKKIEQLKKDLPPNKLQEIDMVITMVAQAILKLVVPAEIEALITELDKKVDIAVRNHAAEVAKNKALEAANAALVVEDNKKAKQLEDQKRVHEAALKKQTEEANANAARLRQLEANKAADEAAAVAKKRDQERGVEAVRAKFKAVIEYSKTRCESITKGIKERILFGWEYNYGRKWQLNEVRRKTTIISYALLWYNEEVEKDYKSRGHYLADYNFGIVKTNYKLKDSDFEQPSTYFSRERII